MTAPEQRDPPSKPAWKHCNALRVRLVGDGFRADNTCRVQYGVRWGRQMFVDFPTRVEDQIEFAVCRDYAHAVRLMKQYPGWEGRVVKRTVNTSGWEIVADDVTVDGGIAELAAHPRQVVDTEGGDQS